MSLNQELLLTKFSIEQGGAYAGERKAEVKFQFSTFRSNEAADGGALYVPMDAEMSLGMSTLDGNRAQEGGGGAVCNGGTSDIHDSNFLDNYANEGVSLHSMTWLRDDQKSHIIPSIFCSIGRCYR